MKNIFNIKTLFYVAIASFIFTSCTDDDFQKPIEETTDVAVTAGSADFSTFVSVGNSLTAGFTDGALFIKGQEMSMPNLLSKKFAMAGGGSFTQPLMADNNGGLLLGGTMIQGPRLYFNGNGPAPITDAPTTEIIGSTPGPFNNMGVPGAKTYHLEFNGYGNAAGIGTYANPYFVRMASSPSASVIQDAVSQSPTFFSLWIGANDVLRYALNGGDGTDQTGNFDPTTYSDADITDPSVFANVYSGLVDDLTAGGAKGVVLNIPNVTDTPYFTTIPYNAIPLDAATAGQLNAGFALYNGGVGQALAYLVSVNVITQTIADAELAKRTVTYAAGQNPALIMDETLIDLTAINPQLISMRSATADDLIVLKAKSFIGTLADPGNPATVNGVAVPLADKWVLLPSEHAEVQTATDAFNATIQAVATAKDLAFVDVNSLMNQLANGGLSFDEFNMTNQYIFGATFSLDGVHPTERGNALIANEIMKAIDSKYGSNFEASGNLNKAVDFVTQYPATIQ